MTQPEAAVAFGLPAERFMYISRWERGEGPGPARSIAVAIAKVTDGAVSIESWDEPALADGEAA